jgi:hypothetical protein
MRGAGFVAFFPLFVEGGGPAEQKTLQKFGRTGIFHVVFFI